MKDSPIAFDSYESTRSAALKKIKTAAESGGSEVLEELSEELDPKKIHQRRVNIEAVRMVVDKCLDSYREGEYEFPVTKRMICEAIKKLR